MSRKFFLSDRMYFSPPSLKTDTLLKHGHTDWLKKKENIKKANPQGRQKKLQA